MARALTHIRREQVVEILGILAMALMFVALFYSRFLLSVAQIIFLVAGLLSFLNGQRFSLSEKNVILLSFGLLLFVPLLTGLYSSDLGLWMERLRIKLPFLLLPMAFILLPDYSSRILERLVQLFLLCAFSSILLVLFWYFQDVEKINEQVRLGGHFPTPCNHIRYALLMAIAFVVALNHFLLQSGRKKWIYLILTLIIFSFLHVLSVRSGLLAAYLGLVISVVFYLIRTRRWRLMLIAPFGVVLFLALAWQIPSFKTKMGYTYWEIQELLSNADNQSTLNSRSKSYHCGWELFSDDPLFGVGVGDVKAEMSNCWKKTFPEDDHFIMPHNQYLSFLVGTGIFLSILMIGVCISPLYWSAFRNSPTSVSILLMLLSSFIFENTIENSLGVAIFSFFIFFSLRYGHIFDQVQTKGRQ